MKKISFTLRMPKNKNDELIKIAEKNMTSKNALINFILSDYFKKEDRNERIRDI